MESCDQRSHCIVLNFSIVNGRPSCPTRVLTEQDRSLRGQLDRARDGEEDRREHSRASATLPATSSARFEAFRAER